MQNSTDIPSDSRVHITAAARECAELFGLPAAAEHRAHRFAEILAKHESQRLAELQAENMHLRLSIAGHLGGDELSHTDSLDELRAACKAAMDSEWAAVGKVKELEAENERLERDAARFAYLWTSWDTTKGNPDEALTLDGRELRDALRVVFSDEFLTDKPSCMNSSVDAAIAKEKT